MPQLASETDTSYNSAGNRCLSMKTSVAGSTDPPHAVQGFLNLHPCGRSAGLSRNIHEISA